MDPYALFAPGGIVQGLTALGNSIGDSFKSYATIQQQRNEAEMARNKMFLETYNSLKQNELSQRRLDAEQQHYAALESQGAQRLTMEQQHYAALESQGAQRLTMEQKSAAASQAFNQQRADREDRQQQIALAERTGVYQPRGPEAYDPDVAAAAQYGRIDLARQGVPPPMGAATSFDPAVSVYQQAVDARDQARKLEQARIAETQARTNEAVSATTLNETARKQALEAQAGLRLQDALAKAQKTPEYNNFVQAQMAANGKLQGDARIAANARLAEATAAWKARQANVYQSMGIPVPEELKPVARPALFDDAPSPIDRSRGGAAYPNPRNAR